MTRSRDQNATRLMPALKKGDPEAVDELFTLVYDELRALARAQRRRWEGDHTLNTTGLVHEAYVRLVDRTPSDWRDRAHFMALAGRAMRHILIDYARHRKALKRGGGSARLSLHEIEEGLGGLDPGEATDEAVLALDESLERLAEESHRQSQIVDCRFFGGMTIEETGEALGISPATVKRGWAAAQAWLYRDLREALGDRRR